MTDLEREMLAIIKHQHKALDWLAAQLIIRDHNFTLTKSPIWQAITEGNKLMQRLEKELQ